MGNSFGSPVGREREKEEEDGVNMIQVYYMYV
jgi:hypothetical protein